MSIIRIPYEFNGTIEHKNYSYIVDRVKQFDDYESLGTDESGVFTLYKIEMGNKRKPPIMLTSSVHGTEFQGTYFTISFLEQLRDNTFPDKELRETLLNDFHIVYIPVVNPWGFNETVGNEYSITHGRRNYNDEDLNRDFYYFTQKESRLVRNVMDKTKPFSYADFHMIRGTNDIYKKSPLIVGNGQHETTHIRDLWVDSIEEYANDGIGGVKWEPFTNMTRGITRRYMRDQLNQYTPYTLSYTVEMVRPTNESEDDGGELRVLSNEEIYKYGMAMVYLFFKTSIKYFNEERTDDITFYDSKIDKVVTPTKKITTTYDENGLVSETLEEWEDRKIKTKVNRNNHNMIESIEREVLK